MIKKLLILAVSCTVSFSLHADVYKIQGNSGTAYLLRNDKNQELYSDKNPKWFLYAKGDDGKVSIYHVKEALFIESQVEITFYCSNRFFHFDIINSDYDLDNKFSVDMIDGIFEPMQDSCQCGEVRILNGSR